MKNQKDFKLENKQKLTPTIHSHRCQRKESIMKQRLLMRQKNAQLLVERIQCENLQVYLYKAFNCFTSAILK